MSDFGALSEASEARGPGSAAALRAAWETDYKDRVQALGFMGFLGGL